MASFTLHWRQSESGSAGERFAHRLAYANGGAQVRTLAESLGDRAWRREFRMLRGGDEVFTDLHRIQDWDSTVDRMPMAARSHLWRDDLQRDLVADGFLDAVRTGAASATAARVLLRADGDALVRFALASLRRPSL